MAGSLDYPDLAGSSLSDDANWPTCPWRGLSQSSVAGQNGGHPPGPQWWTPGAGSWSWMERGRVWSVWLLLSAGGDPHPATRGGSPDHPTHVDGNRSQLPGRVFYDP